MGVLDQVNQLRREGMKDQEIVMKLQEDGVSPNSINEAFNQLRVKRAVSEENYPEPPTPMQQKQPGQFYTPRTKDIEELPEEFEDVSMDENYYSPQEAVPAQPRGYPASSGQQQQEYYPQQYNYDEYSPQPSSATDTDTVIEIAEQVFSEKTKAMQKQLDMLTEFATLAENKIENNTERIKRIERVIDNLQIKILEKVGSYGENLDGVKKEMTMMQESFSKILPELAKIQEHKTHTSHEHHKKE